MKVVLTLLMFLFCQPALALTIATGNKEKLDAIGHPKWKPAQFRFMIPSVAYPPSNDVILIYNILDAYGYGIIKK